MGHDPAGRGAAQDFGPAVAPPARAPYHLTEVEPRPDYTLRLAFADGTHGFVHMREWLFSADCDGTVFAPLRRPALFATAEVDHGFGCVLWLGGQVDFAPETLHREVRAHSGRWNMVSGWRRGDGVR